jgi:endonuclease YncB( thermonuclease family)
MTHDFKLYPELTDSQMAEHYFQSPHKQITEDFRAKVVKVTDGDTIRVLWSERDFTFPVRLRDIQAPEPKERGGKESQMWLERRILGEEVEILVDPDNRVEKWGRLLGAVYHMGLNVGNESVERGHAVPWEERTVGLIPSFKKEMKRYGT